MLMRMDVSINQGWDECFKDNNKIMAVVKRIHDLSPNLYMQTLAKLIIDK
jgi:hypothetical protein